MNISVFIGGDFAPVGRFNKASREADSDLFGELAEKVASSDVSCLNLELPLVTSESPVTKVGPVMAAHPDVLNSVAAAGFNLISLANNHILDHGDDGVQSTLDACTNAGLLTVGAGSTSSEATRPAVINRNGVKLGILAFAEQEFNIAGPSSAGAALLDPVKNVPQIIKLKAECDALVVIIHGGNEFLELPRPGLREICHLYANVGADAVICHHPHVAGAYEHVGHVPIHYSLGNLVFDHKAPPPGWNNAYAVRLNISVQNDGEVAVDQELFPFVQDPVNSRLKLLGGEEKEAFMRVLAERNAWLADATVWKAKWEEYCSSVSSNMLAKLVMPRKFRGSERVFRALGLRSVFFPQRGSNEKLNLLRCPSHREALVTLLEKS